MFQCRFRYAVLTVLTFAITSVGAQPSVSIGSHRIAVREMAGAYSAEAVVEAVRQATVAAQVAGRITLVRAEAGQRVRAGETLMRIDAREASENVAATRAQLTQAKANLDRTRELYAKKFVSASVLDKAEADFKAAQAAAAAASASLSHASVVAPLSGVIAQRHAELGELASPGRPLATVFEPGALRVVANVPQSKKTALLAVKTARVEFPDSGRWIDASRVEVLPTLDAQTHTVTVRVYLPEKVEGIVPGMAARVHFPLGQAARLTVPPQAVLRRGEVAAVYVLDDQGRARLRQVRLGEVAANGEIEILAGLKDGERISLDPVRTGIELRQTPSQSAPKAN